MAGKMSKNSETAFNIALAALTLSSSLIAGLVRKGALSLDEAKEIADQGVLHLETRFGRIPELAPAREIVEAMLQDLVEARNPPRPPSG